MTIPQRAFAVATLATLSAFLLATVPTGARASAAPAPPDRSAEAATAPPAAAPAPTPTECDLLAGHPSDPDLRGPGVPTPQVRAWNDAAIEACRRAVQFESGDARLRYNLGRALYYRGRVPEALPELERAAAAGHRQAQFVLGFLYAEGVPEHLPPDACRALPLWKSAAARGHHAARIAASRDWLRGRYAGCATPPSRAEVREWLDAATPRARGDYYQRLLVEDLKARLAAAP